MKGKYLICMILFLCISCNGNKVKKQNNKVVLASDTIVNRPGIILTFPSDNEINLLKKKHGENFYAIADDANYHLHKCYKLLDSFKKSYVISRKEVFTFNNGFILDKKNYSNKWIIIDYENTNNDPTIYSADLFIANFTSNSQKKRSLNRNITDSTTLSNAYHSNRINGYWRINCNQGSGSLSINNYNAIIEVNSNQIYIKALIKKNNDSLFNLYFSGIKDLGSGGSELNWIEFSKDSAIGTFKFDNSHNTLRFDWLGFYDISVKKRIWQSNSDFQIMSKKMRGIKLINCK